ncbi:MAG: cadmium-translocating P-type ATPase [Anaerolineales bacterium]|nr:cadmium-translocating P-type ATPase [Anaerolineales bacterium]
MTQPLDPSHEPCLNVLHDAVEGRAGIVQVTVDPERAQLAVAYDVHAVSEPEVIQIALALGPTFQKRFETCNLRLDTQGGRACESCALLLEERVRKLDGVRRASASYLGGVLSVTYDQAQTSPERIAQYVKNLGAPVHPPQEAAAPAAGPGAWAGLRRWLTADRLEAILTGLTLLAMLGGLAAQQLAAPATLVTALYAVAYAAGGVFGLKGGLEALAQRTVDVDLLMVLAALGAWLVGAPFEGAMLLFLFSLSNVLQAYAMDRTRNAIRALMKLRPKEALVRRGGRTALLPVERLVVNDIVIVRPGERIPMDGVVAAGESAVDQAPITGESMPVNKQPGEPVLAGTINTTGGLDVRVTKLAQDSTLAKMIKLVEEAHSEKAKTQRWIDRFEQIYAWFVILFTAAVAIVPVAFLGEPFAAAFYRAMTVMVAASPCALVISTPASILSAIGNGARRGVLFKGGVHLEQAAGLKVVAFDKTGTLTEGRPRLMDAQTLAPDLTEAEVLALAAAVEAKSEHPLARAVVAAAEARGLTLAEASGFQSDSGKGVRAVVAGQLIGVGSLRYFDAWQLADQPAVLRELERRQAEGKTAMLVARLEPAGQARPLGLIAVADGLRPAAAAVVRDLKALGVERVVMLTGDHTQVAEAIGRQAGVDEVYAELLPEDKLRLIKELRAQYGSVAMVGDGGNDAPALASATLGVAMGAAGTDVALETADVVLMSDDLHNVPYVIALSRATRRTLLLNLGFALFMIAVMLLSIFSVSLPLPLAVIGHEGGTVLVSLNGLTLLAFRRRPTA